MINESNYHQFLDDFVNGLLNEEMEMDFVNFLDSHPGIMDDLHLSAPEIPLDPSFKNALKKPVPFVGLSIDELLIASLEGDLSKEEEENLAELCKNKPEVEQARTLIALTRLSPDLSIRYPKKKKLRKRPTIVLYSRWVSGIAAAFIFGLLLVRFATTGPGSEIEPGLVAESPTVISPAQTLSAELPDIKSIASTDKEKPKKISIQEKPQVNIDKEAPTKIKIQEPAIIGNKLIGIDLPEIESGIALSRIEENRDDIPEDRAAISHDQSVWQWAYKKLRGKVGVEEIIVPENEIPRDVANLVLAKIAPVFQYNQNTQGRTISIGGVEFSRP